MTEVFSDIMGGNPDGKAKTYGLLVREPCKSSWEFEVLAMSREAMTKAREELGLDFEIEFIEADDEPSPKPAPEPMTEAEIELRDNADAILSATATLWATRVAIARATGNKTAYLAACAAEGITPF